MAIFNNTKNSNIPKKPSASYVNHTFPGDLLSTGRNFCTQIQFIKYDGLSMTALSNMSSGLGLVPTGGITLPLPKAINETQTISWEAASAASQAASIASSISNIGGGTRLGQVVAKFTSAASTIAEGQAGVSGRRPSPFLWMLFKQPNFKEHQLMWTFTPNNEKESNTLVEIINTFKKNSLPGTEAFGTILTYPNIAIIKFFPDDNYTFKFKPCAVMYVNVDYSGGGTPSFFKNGAPTIVNLTVTLKEIELWTQDNYDTP